MSTPLQWLRARVIHHFFKRGCLKRGCNVDHAIHRQIFAFCDEEVQEMPTATMASKTGAKDGELVFGVCHLFAPERYFEEAIVQNPMKYVANKRFAVLLTASHWLIRTLSVDRVLEHSYI